MGRLTIFAKGNLDVRDTLHSLRLGGKLAWNGVGEVVRERFPGWSVRLRHETFTRSDALLEAGGSAPAELAHRALPLGAYPLASQFSTTIFETDADAYVLSSQPDLNTGLVRRRPSGYLLYPEGRSGWSAADRQWLSEKFLGAPALDVSASMDNLARIIERIRSRSVAPILIYNISAVVPGERVHVYEGLEETLSTRIRRLNLALVELSQRTGVSIIDVDRIVALGGADRLKLDALHLTAEACRLVAEGVVRVLEELGCLPSEGRR